MVFYLDTSAFLKRYVRETGSTWVTALYVATAGHTLATGLITKAEAIATFLSADNLLLAAAQQEALTTDNPDLYP